MSNLRRDLQHALRVLVGRPGLSIVRIATLALVLAAGGAVISVANALFLRPLPFAEGDRLIRIYTLPPGTSSFNDANPLHPLEFLRFRASPGPFEAIEGAWGQQRAVSGDGEPESMRCAAVSAGFFQLLGASPVVGRTFTEDEVRDGRQVVVLSHGLWTRRFGASPSVVGSTMTIDREPHEIVGVMDRRFEPAYVESQFWTPLPIREGNIILPGATFIQTLGRLRSDRTLRQAEAELQAALAPIAAESPNTLKGWQVYARTLRSAQFGSQSRALVLLLASIAALSLIAAANLANLTLADVLHRRAELAIRAALGATRWALVWPELLQSLVLAAVGGCIGLAIASWVLPAIIALDPSSQLRTAEFALDWRVMLGALSLAAVVMATAAVVPAVRVARADVASSLAEGGRRSIGSRGTMRLRAWLVATETALALILVSSGALVAAALERTSRVDPGFVADGVLTAQLRLSPSAYDTAEKRVQFVEQVLQRVRAVPGVADASTTMNLFQPGFAFVTLVTIEGRPTPDGQPHTVQFRRVSPGYFRTLRIPEFRGRTFDSRDVPSGLRSAVVSRSFAERFWPGEDPIGRRFQRGGSDAPWTTVIGVVGDTFDVGYGQPPAPTVYLPYAQNNVATSPVSLVVRSAGDPLAIAPQVKGAVREVDSAQPVADLATLQTFLDDSLGPQRFRSVLLGAFALLGLVLAMLGIYAVTARSVVERTREVGVRMALGGSPRRVWLGLSLGALRPFGAGAIAGGLGAVAVAVLLAGVFPEVQSTPRLQAVPAALLLVAAGIVTAVAGARRVTRIDPLIALRSE